MCVRIVDQLLDVVEIDGRSALGWCTPSGLSQQVGEVELVGRRGHYYDSR
jgi:hypothetical protein